MGVEQREERNRIFPGVSGCVIHVRMRNKTGAHGGGIMKKHKRSFILCMVLINFAVLLGSVIYYVKGIESRSQWYHASPETSYFSTYSAYTDGMGYYIDESAGQQGLFTCGPYGELPKGIYDVTVYYESHGSASQAYACTEEGNNYAYALDSDIVILDENATSKTFTIWVERDLADFEVQTVYDGKGSLLIKGVTVTEAAANDLSKILRVLFGTLLLDIAVVVWWHKNKISRENVLTGIVLAVIIGAASLPLLRSGLLNWGTDLNFILMRIEGLKEGILSGVFPVRVQPAWLNNYGYATSVFYGDLFLMLPAVLRMFGFSVQGAYQVYVFVLNVATCLISYFCLKGIFKNRYMALIGSGLYTLSTCRLSLVYILCRGGMLTSFTFLPLIAYGVYLVYFDSKNRKSWILLALGMTGIINSHLLTCEMVAMVLIFVILASAKSFFRKEPVIAMIKAVLLSVALNIGFLVPLLDYTSAGLNISSDTWSSVYGYIQKYGAELSGYFNLFRGSNLGVMAEMPDLVLVLGVLLFWTIYIVIPKERLEEGSIVWRKTGCLVTAVATVLLCMGVKAFPWDWIEDTFPFLRRLINSIQFPGRFFSVATILMVMSIGCSFMILKQHMKEINYKICVLILLGIGFLSSAEMLSHLSYRTNVQSFYDTESLDDFRICTREYLPIGADEMKYTNEYPLLGEGITMTSFERDGVTLQIGCINEGAVSSSMELPLVYYNGYQAVDKNGTELSLSASDNFAVVLTVPENYAGDITVRFKEPISWTLTFWISVLSALALAVTEIVYRQKAKKTITH